MESFQYQVRYNRSLPINRGRGVQVSCPLPVCLCVCVCVCVSVCVCIPRCAPGTLLNQCRLHKTKKHTVPRVNAYSGGTLNRVQPEGLRYLST
jgi:hypothetical protein